jgi:hypothetical protein
LAYFVVRERNEARESADLSLRQVLMFLNPDLYRELYLDKEKAIVENGVEFSEGDIDSADMLLRQLDKRGTITVNAATLEEGWV